SNEPADTHVCRALSTSCLHLVIKALTFGNVSPLLLQKPLINVHVVLGHAAGSKSALENTLAGAAVESPNFSYGLDRIIDGIHYEAGHPVHHHLGNGPVWPSNDQRAASHRLDHYQAGSQRFARLPSALL